MENDLDGQLKEIAAEFRTVAVALESIVANRLVTTGEGHEAQRRLDTLKDLIHEFTHATLLLDEERLDESILAIDALKAECEALDPRDGARPREETLDAIEQDLRVWLYSEGGMPWKKIAIEKECLEKFPELGLLRIRKVISRLRCEALGLAMDE